MAINQPTQEGSKYEEAAQYIDEVKKNNTSTIKIEQRGKILQ